MAVLRRHVNEELCSQVMMMEKLFMTALQTEKTIIKMVSDARGSNLVNVFLALKHSRSCRTSTIKTDTKTTIVGEGESISKYQLFTK